MIQGQKLKELSQASKSINCIMSAFCDRRRVRHYIDIDRMFMLMNKKTALDPREFKAAWNTLESLGIGNLVDDIRTGHRKFLLNYDMKKVGEACLKGIDLDVDHIPRNSFGEPVIKTQVVTRTVERLETIIVIPRPEGKSIFFKIPSDLSQNEQQMIVQAMTKVIQH